MKKQITAELGALYKDIVTGYAGICVAFSASLTGHDMVRLQPQRIDDKGKPDDGDWFDVLSVEKVGEGVQSKVKDNMKENYLTAAKLNGAEVVEIEIGSPKDLTDLIDMESGRFPLADDNPFLEIAKKIPAAMKLMDRLKTIVKDQAPIEKETLISYAMNFNEEQCDGVLPEEVVRKISAAALEDCKVPK